MEPDLAVVNNHWHSVAERRTTLALKRFGASTTLYRSFSVVVLLLIS